MLSFFYTFKGKYNLLVALYADFDVSTGSGLSGGAIAGIVIGSCAFVGVVLALLWKKGYLGGDKEDKGMNNIYRLCM